VPTFEEWVINAFMGKPWMREEYFGGEKRPSGSPFTAAWGDYYCPNAAILAEYMARLFEQPEYLAQEYTAEQLDAAFWFIFGVQSSYCITAREPEVPIRLQIRWVIAIKNLYARLFASVCSEHLGHLNETNGHPLNSAVYMMWDMDCLEGAALFPEKNGGMLVEPVFEVLRHALGLRHAASQESALHGLSHLHWAHPQRVERTIDEYLARGGAARPELIDYAITAREGNVQ
jgi:hypothetical protein